MKDRVMVSFMLIETSEVQQTIGGLPRYDQEQTIHAPCRCALHPSVPPHLLRSANSAIHSLVHHVEKYCQSDEVARMHILIRASVMNTVIHGNHCNPELPSLVRLRITVFQVGIRQHIDFVLSLDDHSPCFDINAVPNPNDPQTLSQLTGRGILLIQDFASANIEQYPRHPVGKTMVISWKSEKDCVRSLI